MTFDLLELDGRDLRREPLTVRRRLLERLVRSHGMVFAARRLSRNGLKAWEEAVARGFEGGVALRAGPLARVAQAQATEVPRGRARVGAEGEIVAHLSRVM